MVLSRLVIEGIKDQALAREKVSTRVLRADFGYKNQGQHYALSLKMVEYEP